MTTIDNKAVYQKKIIEMLRKNDPKALELMYDLYSDMLYGVALKIVQSESKAEEVLSQSFIYINKNFSSFDELKQNFCLWMIGIVRNTAKSLVVQMNGSKNHKGFVYVDSIVTPENPDRIDENSQMSVLQEKVLDLVFLCGENIKDVAELINADESEVRKLLREAVKSCKNKSEPVSWK